MSISHKTIILKIFFIKQKWKKKYEKTKKPKTNPSPFRKKSRSKPNQVLNTIDTYFIKRQTLEN